MGCGGKSFRYEFVDFESAYPLADGQWEVPEEIKTYPKYLDGHKELYGLHHVPEIVQSIYRESLTAIREEAGVLAGLGLRGTVEAICSEQQITGKTLEQRISKLATQGLISLRDAKRLHAIRFLGNDAAHEIKPATSNQIRIALRIIEHLISTLYVLDEDARGKLDTVIDDFADFVVLLTKCLKPFKTGDEFPLAKYLGKEVRRIQPGVSHMESQLVAAIASGTFTRLGVGKLDVFGQSPGKVQHFVVP